MKRVIVRGGAVVLGVYTFVLGAGFVWARWPSASQPCPASGTVVQVDTTTRVLSLCRDGRAEREFRTALGRGCLDKRREGDSKSPLGRYPLGPALVSSRFHRFLPVGYPTLEQRTGGYSGSAIGVHGPHSAFAWLGHATAWPNWTRGCIAVATAGEVEEVARWVRDNSVVEILLL